MFQAYLQHLPESELVTKYRISATREMIQRKGPMSPYVAMFANHISSLAMHDSRALLLSEVKIMISCVVNFNVER